MGNKKLLGGVVAGLAAIALAAGGGTYSAWSDTGTISGNHAQAGVLKLGLNGADGTSAAEPFKHIHLAPGSNFHTDDIWLATNSGDSTPSATLSVTLENLKGTDSSGTGAGQLLDNAHVQFYGYIPNAKGQFGSTGSKLTTVDPQTGGTLNEVNNRPYKLTRDPGAKVTVPYLAPGQGMCFHMQMYLPYKAGNDTQGDSADFDLVFNLEQAASGISPKPYTGDGAPTVSWWNA
jgi:alternate signal-mediated exported protein